MAVGTNVSEHDGIFFITFTCFRWMHLFEITNSYDLIYKWFDYLKTKGHFICSYVIMPNHLHVIIGLRASDKSVNTIVSNGKRFLAYALVERLKAGYHKDIVDKLVDGVSRSDEKRGKLHQVFQPSFDCKECYSNFFIVEKLNYIHNNPCKGKWNLANSPIDYKHSSARFYYTGEHSGYEVTSYKELEDVDLTTKRG